MFLLFPSSDKDDGDQDEQYDETCSGVLDEEPDKVADERTDVAIASVEASAA